LIATDVSARGLDVKGVDFVVNYDLPELPENYVHRIGRTGRGASRGRAISFCSEEEKVYLNAIQEYIGKEIEVMKISKGAYEETVAYSEANTNDWKQLINEAENEPKRKKRKK